MNDELGQASFTITADVSQLESQLNKAKASLNSVKGDTDLGNLTINAEGFSGSLAEYQKFQESQASLNYDELNKERQEAIDLLMQEAQANRELYEQKQQLAAANQAEAASEGILAKLATAYNNVAGKITGFFVNAGDAIQGNLLRVTDSIDNAGYRGRAVLIGFGAAITAFATSSIKEFAKYDQAFADSQADAEKSLSRLKAGFGQILAPIAQVGYKLLEFAANNKELTTAVITFTGVLVGGTGLIALISKLKLALDGLRISAGGVIGIVSLIAGVAAAFVSANATSTDFSMTLKEMEQRQKDLTKATESLNKAQKSYNSSMADVSKQIAKINKERQESIDEYRQNLKQIEVDHKNTIDELTQQILDANDDYARAIEERNAEFAVSQAEEEKEHQKKVDELMAQINFLQRYNNKYNQEKLSQLQFALAKENRLYQQQTQAEQEELQLRNEQDRIARDEKLAKYQQELDEELAFMDKHREELASVRDVILLDEIENLKKQQAKQQESYDEQIQMALEKGAAAAQSWADAYSDYLEQTDEIKKSYDTSIGNDDYWYSKGADAGKTFSAIFNGTVTRSIANGSFWDALSEGFENIFAGNWGYWSGGRSVRQGYATGGYTGRGGENEIAGVVHRGEYVIPAESVDQTTGKPKLGNTVININVSGTFATSAQERRKVAEQIADALIQTNSARSLA